MQGLAFTDDSTIRVSGSFNLKLPLEEVAYASQDAHVGFSVEVSTTTDDLDTIIKAAQQLRAELTAAAKLAVFAELGVNFKESDIGVLSPDLSGFQAASKPATGGGRKPAVGSGGSSARRGAQSGDRPAPKASAADRDSLDRYDVRLPNGRNATIVDQRPLKESGQYKPTAPDFKVDEPNGQGFWLYQKDGSTNDDITGWLEDNGVPW